MILRHNDVEIKLREEAGVIVAHFNLYGKFTVSDFKWMRRGLEFYAKDIGYVMVAPDESDAKIMRLVNKLGFKRTDFEAVYKDHTRRFYVWQTP